MEEQQKQTTLSREAIKKSELNKRSLESIENEFSTRTQKAHTMTKYIPLISSGSTALLLIIIIGGIYGLYGLVFGRESRLAIVGSSQPLVETGQQEPTPQPGPDQKTDTPTKPSEAPTTKADPKSVSNSTTKTQTQTEIKKAEPTNKYCSKNSKAPDQVCQAILSIKNDRTSSNKFLSIGVVSQLESLPKISKLTIKEKTWKESPKNTGEIQVAVTTSDGGDYLTEATLTYSAGQWTVKQFTVIEGIE